MSRKVTALSGQARKQPPFGALIFDQHGLGSGIPNGLFGVNVLVLAWSGRDCAGVQYS